MKRVVGDLYPVAVVFDAQAIIFSQAMIFSQAIIFAKARISPGQNFRPGNYFRSGQNFAQARIFDRGIIFALGQNVERGRKCRTGDYFEFVNVWTTILLGQVEDFFRPGAGPHQGDIWAQKRLSFCRFLI